jgi:hypothetical protein
MRQQAVLFSCVALLVLVPGSYAQDKQPFLGVLLDETPLPELLTKHLGLEPGQGLRVINISTGTAADKAGLDRDDIIMAFQGRKVTDVNEFIDAVKKAGVGAKVAIGVIHLGQRKTVELQLEPLEKMEWKYPSEPEIVTSWRPGRVFQIGPDGKQWEIPVEKLPDLNLDVSKLFKYTYRCTANGENYAIVIEGNPAREDTKVVVRAGEMEYNATVGQIDKLPEKYRDSVRHAVENAKNIQVTGKLRFPELPQPDVYKKLFNELPRPDMDRLVEEKDRTIEKLREQMDKLQQRMQQLEEKLIDRKSNAEPKPDKTGQIAPPQTEQKSSV